MATSLRNRDLLGRAWKTLPLALMCLAACTGQSSGGVASATASAPKSVEVQLSNADGKNVATAVITEGLSSEMASAARVASAARQTSPSSGVTVAISVTDLPPGTHGFHVHAVGRCDTPDFTSSGPHLNPDKRTHGVKSERGPHAGDLPNLTVDKDHTAVSAFFVDHLTFSQIESSSTGTSLLIDANPDDNMSDPDGGSGKHIACGVIRAGVANPSPTPSPTANNAAAAMNVTFTGLRQGTFPVHLHSRCNGSQTFHIAVLGDLVVNAAGSGSISVPEPDFGHGWCVIVYGDPSLQTVAATQTI
jgi:Cu-Zn family superoxide dismutase